MSIAPLFSLFCGGLLILLFAGIGVYAIYASLKSKKKAESSQNWPSAPGIITEASVKHSTSRDTDGDVRHSYMPRVAYTYSLIGQEYSGDKITFGFQQSFSNQTKAEQALSKYVVGSAAAVYYNPEDPNEAVLEKTSGGSTVGIIVGSVLLFFSICLGCPLLFILILAPLASGG